ncbi:unnamed protein product, partial [Discosporangium mesarthrocarpum]
MAENEALLREKLLGSIGGGPFELVRAFRKMHRGRGVLVDYEDFKVAIKNLGLALNEEEVWTFFRAFDEDGTPQTDLLEFCEWVGGHSICADRAGGVSGGGREAGAGQSTGTFRPTSGGSEHSVSKRKIAAAQVRVKEAQESQPVRSMAENESLLREKILGSIGGGPFELLRAFRKMHRGRGTVVDFNDFQEAVRAFGLGLKEEEVKAFFACFDEDGSGGIDFQEFCAWVGNNSVSVAGGG